MSDDSSMNIMLGAVFAVAGIMVLAPTLQRMFPVVQLTQYLEAQAYAGLIDSRELKATNQLRWLDLINNPPYTPWVTADFFNNGPDTIYIAINYPTNFHELLLEDRLVLNFIGADRRMELVFYKCDIGKRAEVTVAAKY